MRGDKLPLSLDKAGHLTKTGAEAAQAGCPSTGIPLKCSCGLAAPR